MKENNRTFKALGVLAIVGVGGYALWRNRFKVQRLLESNGIKTPWMDNSVAEGLQSGAAKIAGSVEHEVKSLTRPANAPISNAAKDFSKAI